MYQVEKVHFPWLVYNDLLPFEESHLLRTYGPCGGSLISSLAIHLLRLQDLLAGDPWLGQGIHQDPNGRCLLLHGKLSQSLHSCPWP